MSKILNVTNGNYTVKVQNGGEIRLDTGSEIGSVIVTGNLKVLGNTITTTETEIEDNLIVLNSGETGDGISLGTSGIEIDRGLASNAFVLYDESITRSDPENLTFFGVPALQEGSIVFKRENNTLIDIKANRLFTEKDKSLYLINEGTGVLTVTGTTDYEQQVFHYVNGELDPSLGPKDDDIIPNARALVDYITGLEFLNDRITEGNTFVEIKDDSVTGISTEIDITVDGLQTAKITPDSLILNRIQRIEAANIDQDLSLITTGTGAIKIQNVLELDDVSYTPLNPDTGVKIYSQNIGNGGSGIYFVDKTDTRDELVSKNRSLLMSMMF